MDNTTPMDSESQQARILALTALANDYCTLLENARNFEKEEFISEVLNCLPRIYIEFLDLKPEDSLLEYEYFPSYVDEDFYESIRLKVEGLMGADDIFLETFEEDMKYSDTPIAASISECLADIFQPLYNFISIVRESESEQALEAYRECRENFVGYWSQTLCNVMRALNNLHFKQ